MNTISDDLSDRKTRHLEICLDSDKYQVETGDTLLDRVHFYHRALPEISLDVISTKTSVLGYEARGPVFISCMTGGSEKGYQLNRLLAEAAQEIGIPVGIGSFRVLGDKPETLTHFRMRKFAPTVPILANIGAVQVRDIPHTQLIETAKNLEATAQVIHCNPGQELFQNGGDRDFKGLKEALYRFINLSPLPVIIKETGFGLLPGEVKDLLDHGAYAVDVAGSGGTNWLKVEACRDTPGIRELSRQFDDWGHPTALLLAALSPRGKVWASGGIRTGMDIAKVIALGADMAGVALKFIRSAARKGIEGVIDYYQGLEKTLKTVMLLTGSPDLAALRQAPRYYDPWFAQQLQLYQDGLKGGII